MCVYSTDTEETTNRQHNAQPGAYVQLSVTDTGVGIDAETQAHLFEPFFKRKGLGGGSGLGLAKVCGIIRQSGGFIELVSEPGAGSTFTISLPRCETIPPGPTGRPTAGVVARAPKDFGRGG